MICFLSLSHVGKLYKKLLEYIGVYMETKIVLIRHGESLANAGGIYLGHTDWDLTEKGKMQAETVANHLRNEKIDLIYSSDLIRAYNTALPHSKIHGLDIIKSRELREIYLGKWEGKPLSEIEERWQDEFIHGWRENFGTCQTPGGESVPHLANRIYEEVKRIARENEGKYIVIATHAAAIRAFWGKITKTPENEVAQKIPFPQNASCTTVKYERGELIPVEYGFADYLKNIV